MYDQNYWLNEYDKYGLPTVLVDVATGGILKINSEALSLFGVSLDFLGSLEGRLFKELKFLCNTVYSSEIERLIGKIVKVAQSGKCASCMLKLGDANVSEAPVMITLYPVRNSAGEVVTVAVVAGSDEDCELEDEQPYLYRLIEAAPFGCVVFDSDFNPVFCNYMSVTMFQEESKQALLAHINDYLFEGVSGEGQRAFYRNIVDNLYMDGSFQMSATHTTATGGYLETSMTLSLMHYKGEDRIVVYLLDISEHRRVLDMYVKLAMEASMDQLTGVKNRGHFEMKLKLMLKLHKQTGKPLYLVIMDIDDFKHINDTYGHIAGDEVLKRLGAVLCENIRPADVVSRYGGEEFVVLFENMSMAAIKQKMEGLREVISNTVIPLPSCCGPKHLCVTVSIGVAQFNPELMPDEETFCVCADTALYRAKREGKNCIRVYGE